MALDFPSSPTNGQTYTANNITWVYETSSTTWKVKQDGTAGKTRIASVKDIKGPAADGGAIAAETWTTRDLNTITDPSSIGISVSSDSSGTGNYMTVPAGTYKITWRAPGWRIYTFKTILEYSTDSTFATGVTKVIGSSEYSSTVGTDGQNSQSNSVGLVPSVTFTETTYVRIRQWSAVAKSSPDNGLGVATINNLVIPSRDSQENNVFTLVEIEDLATTVKDNATYVEGTSRTAIVKDQKNKGVQGGDFIKDVWRDRDLTVEDDPFNFVTLYPTTNGQTTPSPGNTPGYFSLPTGKYQITFTAVAHDVGKNVAAMIWSSTQSNINKTYAVTDSRDGEFYGTSMACAGASTLSKGSEVVEITETSFFKVIHFCKSSNSGSGFGQAVDIGTPDKETYLIIEIEDLATAVKDNAVYVEGTSKVAILKDQKNYTVAGGTFNQNTWVDRDLTVEEDPQNFVNFTAGGSQSSPSPGNTPGYWSLPAGTYKIDWSAVGYMVGNHTCWLVWSTTQSEITTAALNANISAAGDYEEGSAARASASTDESMTDSSGYKVITISQPTYFKLLHRCTDSQTTNGLGRPISQDGVLKNIYTQVRIEDLATAVKNSESTSSTNNVWHVEKTDAQEIHTNPVAWTDITGLSQTVTSTSASTQFLINATVNASVLASGSDGLVRLMRGTTVIGSTSSESSATTNTTGFGQVSGQNSWYESNTLCITYLDTPGVGTHTYHIEGINADASVGMMINRRGHHASFYVTSHMSIQKYT